MSLLEDPGCLMVAGVAPARRHPYIEEFIFQPGGFGNIPPETNEFSKIDIPLNQLSSLKAMGVTPAYVSKMKEKGFVSDDLNRYIRLKNAFD